MIKPPISRICPSILKFLSPRVLQQKVIIAFLLYWFQFIYRLVLAFMTNDRQVYHGFFFIQSILFSFYLGQILSAVRLKIYPPRTKFVKSRQTICTCKMLMKTENNLFASARLLLIVLVLFRHYLASRAFFFYILFQKALLALFWISDWLFV